MIKLEEAVKLILDKAKPLAVKEAPVLKSLGLVLRQDVTSPLFIPPFDKSAMDGYAVRARDVKGASKTSPVVLEVIEDVPAGKVGKQIVGKGFATRIMTGAPIPKGAEAVVMVEDTESPDRKYVKIFKEVSEGSNIAKTGEDVKKGDIVLKAGRVIGAAEMGMIASVGKKSVKVGVRPKVVVVSTGNEVLMPGRNIEPGKIYDSNGYSLTGMAMKRGAKASFGGIAEDHKYSLRDKFIRAGRFDILVLSGGVSMGDYDIVQDTLAGLNIERLFWKVFIKPGMPTYVGMYENRFVFGLPGNPVSCMVTFELFVAPAIDAMLGKSEIGPKRGKAVLRNGMKIKQDRRKFYRGKLSVIDGREEVELYRDQASGILRSMIESNVLIDIPGDAAEVKAGQIVDIIYLE